MKIKSRLQVKLSTANRFREFSQKNNSNQSETLDLMLDFFEKNNLSPFETLVPSKVSLENLIKKRINGMIAIIWDIEKNQTKPTTAMLQALLEQEEPKKKPLLVEKKRTTGNQPNYREHNR